MLAFQWVRPLEFPGVRLTRKPVLQGLSSFRLTGAFKRHDDVRFYPRSIRQTDGNRVFH
jgi:hypothetical protein